MRAVSHIQFYCDRALRYSDGVHFSRRPGHSIVMIVMNVSQCMRELDDNPRYSEMADCTILRKASPRCVFIQFL